LNSVILQLLQQGYTVRTTVRSLNREDGLKVALGGAGATSEELSRLSFFEADLLRDEGWKEASEGATYVHHVASPFPPEAPKDENELIIPAREG
jgi:dihydroflavonol-4-reductase